MDILYVSDGCPGCDRVLQVISQNPRIRSYLTVKWVDRDTFAMSELLATGAKAKPALVTDAGTQFARLFVNAGQIEQVFASRYR